MTIATAASVSFLSVLSIWPAMSNPDCSRRLRFPVGTMPGSFGINGAATSPTVESTDRPSSSTASMEATAWSLSTRSAFSPCSNVSSAYVRAIAANPSTLSAMPSANPSAAPRAWPFFVVLSASVIVGTLNSFVVEPLSTTRHYAGGSSNPARTAEAVRASMSSWE